MKSKPHIKPGNGINRREFLATTAATLAAVTLTAKAETLPPLLDLHQHPNYVGRTDEQVVAHQEFHGVTQPILLPGAGWMLAEVGDNRSCADVQSNYSHLFVR